MDSTAGADSDRGRPGDCDRVYAQGMSGDSRLGAALSEALGVITQLFFHASVLKALDHPLAKRCYAEWVATMVRSDRLLEAVLRLGGRPASRRATRTTYRWRACSPPSVVRKRPTASGSAAS